MLALVLSKACIRASLAVKKDERASKWHDSRCVDRLERVVYAWHPLDAWVQGIWAEGHIQRWRLAVDVSGREWVSVDGRLTRLMACRAGRCGVRRVI